MFNFNSNSLNSLTKRFFDSFIGKYWFDQGDLYDSSSWLNSEFINFPKESELLIEIGVGIILSKFFLLSNGTKLGH